MKYYNKVMGRKKTQNRVSDNRGPPMCDAINTRKPTHADSDDAMSDTTIRLSQSPDPGAASKHRATKSIRRSPERDFISFADVENEAAARPNLPFPRLDANLPVCDPAEHLDEDEEMILDVNPWDLPDADVQSELSETSTSSKSAHNSRHGSVDEGESDLSEEYVYGSDEATRSPGKGKGKAIGGNTWRQRGGVARSPQKSIRGKTHKQREWEEWLDRKTGEDDSDLDPEAYYWGDNVKVLKPTLEVLNDYDVSLLHPAEVPLYPEYHTWWRSYHHLQFLADSINITAPEDLIFKDSVYVVAHRALAVGRAAEDFEYSVQETLGEEARRRFKRQFRKGGGWVGRR